MIPIAPLSGVLAPLSSVPPRIPQKGRGKRTVDQGWVIVNKDDTFEPLLIVIEPVNIRDEVGHASPAKART